MRWRLQDCIIFPVIITVAITRKFKVSKPKVFPLKEDQKWIGYKLSSFKEINIVQKFTVTNPFVLVNSLKQNLRDTYCMYINSEINQITYNLLFQGFTLYLEFAEMFSFHFIKQLLNMSPQAAFKQYCMTYWQIFSLVIYFKNSFCKSLVL